MQRLFTKMFFGNKMIRFFLWWVFVFLFSTAISPYGVGYALVACILGGGLIGFFLFRHFSSAFISSVILLPRKYPIYWLTVRKIVLVLLFVCLLFSGRFPVGFSVGSFCLVVLLNLRVLGRKSTSFDAPFIIILVLSILSIFLSVDPQLSQIGAFKTIAGIGWFYFLVTYINNKPDFRLFCIWMGLMGIALAIVGPFFMELSRPKYPLIPHFYFIFSNGLPKLLHFNFLGGIMTFLFPFFVGLALSERENAQRFFWVCSVLTGLCIIFIQSRSSLFGALFGISFIVLYKNGRVWFWGGIGIVLTCGLCWGLFGDHLDIWGATDTGVSRIKIWYRALDILQDFPFTGVGYLTFPFIVDMFYPLELLNAQVPHPHNTFLDFACTLGLPGLVAFSILIGCWLGQCLDMLKLGHLLGNYEWRFLSLGIIAGVVGHFVYGLTDAMIVGRTVGMVYWTFLAISTIMWQFMCEEFLKRKKYDAVDK